MSHISHTQPLPLIYRFRSPAQIPQPTRITHAHSQNSDPLAPAQHTHARYTCHPEMASTLSPKTQPRAASQPCLHARCSKSLQVPAPRRQLPLQRKSAGLGVGKQLRLQMRGGLRSHFKHVYAVNAPFKGENPHLTEITIRWVYFWYLTVCV